MKPNPAWSVVGGGPIGTGQMNSINMTLDSSDHTLYIAYALIVGGSAKASVVKLTDHGWEQVGSSGFSEKTASGISIAVHNGVPYVAFAENSASGFRASVMKFVNNTWTYVGSARFSANKLLNASRTSIAVDGTNIYISFKQNSGTTEFAAMKYDESNPSAGWQPVGDALPSSAVTDVSVQSDMALFNGRLYAAYQDADSADKLRVIQYVSGQWQDVGSGIVSQGVVNDMSLAYEGGALYVAYMEGANDKRLAVKKFENGVWSSVGDAAITKGAAFFPSMAFDNGTMYVTYQDDDTLLNPIVGNARAYVITYGTPRTVLLSDRQVPFGTALDDALPKSIPMDWADGTTGTAAVTWDGGAPTYDAKQSGEYIFTGQIAIPAGMQNKGERYVKLKVIVGNPSHDASLAGLTLSAGELDPVFTAGTKSYTASVAESVTSIGVTPTVADGKATVKVNDATAASGMAFPVSLSVGENVITVDVTAQDEATTESYTITVTRAAPLFDAETPNITAQPSARTAAVGSPSPILTVSAAVNDGGSLGYQWYSNTTDSNVGGIAIDGAQSASFAAPTSVAGTTYYYVDVTNTNSSATGSRTATETSNAAAVIINEASVPAPMAPTIRSAVAADSSVTIEWSAVPDATGYNVYQRSGSESYGLPAASVSGTVYSYQATGLTNGTTFYFTVTATNDGGESGASDEFGATPVTVPSASSDNEGAQPAAGHAEHSLGTVSTTQVNGRAVTTVTVDGDKLKRALASQGERPVVTIAADTQSGAFASELNGEMVKNLEQRNATLKVKTQNAFYTLPAAQINIDALLNQFGSQAKLQDIKVRIEIAEPTADIVAVAKNAAAEWGFELVVPPLSFTVKGTYEGKSMEVSNFNAYVERTIAIPDGVDPKTITTGVVIEPDGTVRHVPTKLEEIDGKYYAKVSSLTNSTYSLVWHPLEFNDVGQHWAKDAINDMGSRMIVGGVGEGKFNPNENVTRAEFAAILVRGLGLQLTKGDASFTDVSASEWYAGAVQTAYDYRLASGFEDGTFRPLDKITREQATEMIAKAMAITKLSDKLQTQATAALPGSFADADEVSAWAVTSVADSLRAGIISGRSSHELAPQANMTRAEVAVIVQRLLQRSDLI